MKSLIVLLLVLLLVCEQSQSQNNKFTLFPFAFEQPNPIPDSIHVCFVKVLPDNAKNIINSEIYAEPSLEWLIPDTQYVNFQKRKDSIRLDGLQLIDKLIISTLEGAITLYYADSIGLSWIVDVLAIQDDPGISNVTFDTIPYPQKVDYYWLRLETKYVNGVAGDPELTFIGPVIIENNVHQILFWAYIRGLVSRDVPEQISIDNCEIEKAALEGKDY
jgi:hypothetical protein